MVKRIKQEEVDSLMRRRICPPCGKKIDSLIYFSKVDVTQDFDIDEDGEPTYSAMDGYGSHSNEEYACPACHLILCTDEESAIQFLKRKDEQPRR